MIDLFALLIVLIFVLILYSIKDRDITVCDVVLFTIAAFGLFKLLCSGEMGGADTNNDSQDKSTEAFTGGPEPLYEDLPERQVNTYSSYDPLTDKSAKETEHLERGFFEGDPLTMGVAENNQELDTSFDDYGMKGYIPGYSDVYLYNKDNSDVFADLYRSPTEEGVFRYGKPREQQSIVGAYTGDDDSLVVRNGGALFNKPTLNRMLEEPIGSRGDNYSAQYHAQQQKRAKENLVNQSRRTARGAESWYAKELNANENREWWGQDNLYDRVGLLR